MLGGVVGYVVPFASGRPRTDARDYAKDGGYLGTFFGLCVYGFYRALAAIA
jgi:hypothetical protein